MFDVLVAAQSGVSFAGGVANALRTARFRVLACEVNPGASPPSGVQVDAAVACAGSPSSVGELARRLRAGLEGPPPVIGMSRGAASAPEGTVDILSDDAPDSLVVARVQRAAAGRERRRARAFLSGRLADVGPRALLSTLEARGSTCVVRVRSESRRAEITVERGAIVHGRADGAASTSLEDVMCTVESWTEATFEVLGDGGDFHRNSPATAHGAPANPGDAPEVALAAAVMNAVSGYARAFLPSDFVTTHLEATRIRTRGAHPSLDAFAVSRTGMVSATRMSLAREGIAESVAAWCNLFFGECARTMPSRFQRGAITGILGGLTRLLERVGWDTAMFGAEEH